MNRTRVHPRIDRRSILASAIACCFAPGWGHANPVGPAVTHGSAHFSTQGKLLQITNSPGTIINWQGFSIGAGETTRFIQQNSASAVLNRVVGRDPSAIFGSLQSNGRVFLINPNGIVFGAGAHIDTAGLVASTLNIMDADFLKGRMRFGDTPGAGPVSNAGEIRTPTGGRVLLISPEGVENSGIIHAPKGEVILAAGKTVELADSANPEVRVEISSPQTRAINLGEIVAESGRVGIYGAIVANRGLVSADSAVVDANGKIVFKATRQASPDGDNAAGAKVAAVAGDDDGRIIFKSAEAGGENGVRRVSAVVNDDGRTVFRSAPEGEADAVTATGARAVVSEHGRVIFQEVAPAPTPQTITVTGAGNGTSAAPGTTGGVVAMKATHEASLDAGSVTSANGRAGGRIEVDAGSGTALVAGSVQATGASGAGGEVRVLGERVGVFATASIDVSGERGGGTALIGGDLQGANPSVRNAQMTYFGPDASVKADARTAGDGGKVIVWAEDSTRSYGAISARGGNDSGNGGFVETSGKMAIDVRRGPDLRAPKGKPGIWLVDPVDIDVVPGSELDPLLNTGTPIFAPLGESSRIGVELINAQLAIGSDVTLNTTSRGDDAGAQAGNITIQAPIIKTDDEFGTTTLRLQAHNDVVIMPGASIVTTGAPMNVVLQANADGAGGGGVTVGAPVVTRGGSFTASGRDSIAINAAINTLNESGTSGGSVQLNSTGGAVSVAAPIAGGFSVTASAQGGAMTLASGITATGNVSLQGKTGVNFSAGSSVVTGPFSSFSATATDPGAAIDIPASVTIASRGATLTADSMNIQGTVNAVNGTITVRQNNSGRPLNLGSEVAGTLSITQAEFSHLQTTGSLLLGNSSTGAVTVNGALSGSPSIVSVASGTSYTQNASISFPSSRFDVNAPTVAIAAPLSAGTGISITADTLNVGSTVSTSGNLDVSTRSFNRRIDLGVASATGTALELTDAQIDMLSTPTRLRFTSSSEINIVGPISPAGATTLGLFSSSSTIQQSPTAAITVPSLAASGRTQINLPADNNVDNFAAQIVCCSAGDINFVAAAGKLVNITTVDGVSGVRVNNSSGTGNVMLQADDLNVAAQVRANVGNVKVTPRTDDLPITLGGSAADTLSLSNAELGLINGTQVDFSANTIDVAGPASFVALTTVLGPVDAGRTVNVVGAKTGTALEFLPGEIAFLSGNNVVLGGPNAGAVSVLATTTAPATLDKLTLHSGGTGSSVTVGLSTPLTAANNIGLIADTVDLQSNVTSTGGNIEIATNSASQKIDVGADFGSSSLGLSLTELGRLSAPTSRTISFTTAGGDIDVTGTVGFGSSAAFDAGGTFTLLSASSLGSTSGSLSVRAQSIDIQGQTTMTAGGAGSITLAGNAFTISSVATTITAPGDINVLPRNFSHIDLGGAGSAGTIGLDNGELGTMMPGGVLRIGENTTGVTGNISISAPITLPGRTLSLKTIGGGINQAIGAPITAANLAAYASDDISLNAANVIGGFAAESEFAMISAVRAPGGVLTVGTFDGASGVRAGTFFGGMPVVLRADRIDVNAPIVGSDVTLLPSAGGVIDLGTKGAGFSLTQTEFDRIFADKLTIGEAASSSLNVSAPITIGTFEDLSLWAASITVPQFLNNTTGSVELVADDLAIGAPVTALDQLTVRPLTGTRHIDLGTETAGKLSLTNAEVANLLTPTLTFGPTPRIDVTASIFTLAALEFITDDLTIPSGAMPSLSALDLFVRTMTAGRSIDLGTAGTGTFMGLDAATLGKLAVSRTLSFSSAGASSITVSAPLTSIPTSDLALSAGTLNINEAIAAPGDIALRANTLNIATGSVTSTGGGDIGIAPRDTMSFTFGTGGLMDSAKLGRFATSGLIELGSSTTSSISIAQPLDASAFGGLMLTASGNITQTAGSTITAPKLGVRSQFGSVTLTENNAISGPFAAATAAFGTLSFTETGTLQVGTVGDLIGIFTGTATLRSDGIDILNPISASTVTLAPRIAGTAINLGTDAGYGLTDAEIDRIFASTLNLGTSTSNPSGPITVSAPVSWDSGNSLNLATAAGSSIAVNAALGSANSGNISMNSGAGGSVSIAAPVTTAGSITVTADNIATSQPMTTQFGSVSLTNVGAGGSVSVGAAIDSGSSVAITTDNLAINAPIKSGFAVTLQPRTNDTPVNLGAEAGGFSVDAAELALIDASQLTVGSSTAGDLTVNAPIGPFKFDSLVLRSGGDVTQTPGSTITVRGGDENFVTGSLSVFAGGTINLPEANDIAVSVSGSASGSAKDFIFNNVSPLRLQNVSGIFASGKVIIRTAVPSTSGDAPLGLIDAILVGLEKAQKAGEDLKKDAEERKEEAEKREREEQKKAGTPTCS